MDGKALEIALIHHGNHSPHLADRNAWLEKRLKETRDAIREIKEKSRENISGAKRLQACNLALLSPFNAVYVANVPMRPTRLF